MKNFLKTFTVLIPSAENEASLSATGDALTVYETNAPFIVRDEFGSLFEIDRACRVESEGGDKFGRLTFVRPQGVTGDINIRVAVGSGIRFYDGRLQYTSSSATTNNVKAEFAVTALPPSVRSRFLPRFTASAPLIGDAVYAPDITAGPKVTGGAVAGMNLLAPADPSVVRRVLRLNSGAAVKVGQAPDRMGIAGQTFELTTAAPEREIEGSESLFAKADADADLTVFEVLKSTLPAPALGAYPMPAILPDPNDWPEVPRTLSARISAAVAHSVQNWAWNIALDGLPNGIAAHGGALARTGIPLANSADAAVGATGAFSISITGAPELACGANYVGNSADKIGTQPFTAYLFLNLSQRVEWYNSMSSVRWPALPVTFSTGQSFYLMAEDNYGTRPTTWSAMRRFRVGIPFDGSAPFVEQCHCLNEGETPTWERASKPLHGVNWWVQA